MKISAFLSFPILSILALSACRETTRKPPAEPEGEPVVYTSIAPLAGLVEKIAGEQIEVRSLVNEASDPHDFSPTPKQLVALSRSAVFFTAGMPFEKLLIEKLQDSARGLRIVDLTEGIALRGFDEESRHPPGPGHNHGNMDSHVWLSPPLLKQQISPIVEALQSIAPTHASLFRERGEKLETEIAGLHTELTKRLSPLRGRRFYAYHGAFGYFAEAYGLVQEAIETGGRRPEQKRIYALIESAREEGVTMIFVQPQFDPLSARTIAEAIGGEVVPIDPMSRDVFGTLRKIAEAVSSERQGR